MNVIPSCSVQNLENVPSFSEDAGISNWCFFFTVYTAGVQVPPKEMYYLSEEEWGGGGGGGGGGREGITNVEELALAHYNQSNGLSEMCFKSLLKKRSRDGEQATSDIDFKVFFLNK